MQNFRKSVLVLVFLSVLFGLNLQASENTWPKEIELKKHTLVIYQPQPQDLTGNTLKILAAISVESKANPQPVFGAMWFEAQIDVDKSENRATLGSFVLTKLQFSLDEEDNVAKLEKLIESRMPKLSFDISYQKLLSTLEIQDMQKKESTNLKTDAPQIIVTREPSVLISIKDDARLKPIDKTKLFRVINTPYTLIMDSNSNKYYLNANETTWYSASSIKGTYEVDSDVPKEVEKHKAKVENKEKVKLNLGKIPKVIVVTEPTELISCDGEPEFTPIDKTSLMYVSNTESDLFMEIKSQKYYVLLSGRWYVSKNLDKNWKYVSSDALPKTFSQIPPDSDSSNVLYAISGTTESKDAVIDAQIPQTASVNRKTAELHVEYDGSPEYKKIKGTSLSYIVNTQTPVILVGKIYYACDNAVWFEADSPDGKWRVATSVNEEIYSIPTSSPMYSVTFVKIYKVTDDTVYVGYTAGYTNTYIYNTTIVYGTGYNYTPWYGNYYYPYPSPWGFHMRYSPWYGWGFGMSYSSGPFTFYIGGGGWYGGGYWGHAPYYRYGGGYHRGYHNGFRQGYVAGRLAGSRPHISGTPRANHRNNNLYKSAKNKDRVKNTRNKVDGGNRFKSQAQNKRQNNVFADKNGGVHRKTDNGWEKRNSTGWDKQRTNDRSSRNNLDKSFQSRDRGNNFSRGSFSGGGFSGGSRGGFSGSRGGFGGGGRRR